MSMIRIFLLMLCVVCFSTKAEVDIKGSAHLIHKGWGSPSVKDKQILQDEAINAAVSRWASQKGSSFLKNYELVRSEIEENLDDYVISSSVLTEDYDKKSKRLNIVVKVTLDDTRLINMVNGESVVANSATDEKSLLTFIFVSRRSDSIQQFDEKVYKRSDTTNAEEGTENESGGASGIAYQSKTSTSQEVTSGGSRTLKADKTTYSVASAAEINIAMSEVFGSAGFEVVDAEFVEEETAGLLSVDAFKRDFSAGDDVSGATQRNAAKGARMIDLPYLAVGTLDIGMATVDSSTGLKRVAVTVTGKMLDLAGRFPKTVAAVGPVQIAGIGPTTVEAERNALKMAAEKAASELVNQLNSKSIK